MVYLSINYRTVISVFRLFGIQQSISSFENKVTKMNTRTFHMSLSTDFKGSTTALETMRKQYYAGTYTSDHWALQSYELKDSKVIGLANHRGSEYAIYLNPTDKRGYRCIVRLICNEDMKSAINRDYTAQEQRGMSLVVELVESAFRQVVPIVQTFKAGNNSHKFDSETRMTYIGKAEEPSFLHTHVIGRGDPEAEYIEGIQLDGPVPGLNFDMMGKTMSEPGNDKKVKWKDLDMINAVNCLKIKIEKSKREYEEFGLVVITE